jgi:hypothetical protein
VIEEARLIGEVRTYKPDEVEATKAWLAERKTG